MEKYIPIALSDLKANRNLPKSLRGRTLNNVVFSLLQYDEVERAESLLGELSQWIHIDAYATATFGLFHAKCGNMDRAERYYREAISLVHDKVVKARFRQRMYLEIGKSHLKYGKHRDAQRYLEKAANAHQGNDFVKKDARQIINSLRDKGST